MPFGLPTDSLLTYLYNADKNAKFYGPTIQFHFYMLPESMIE